VHDEPAALATTELYVQQLEKIGEKAKKGTLKLPLSEEQLLAELPSWTYCPGIFIHSTTIVYPQYYPC
jgi:hypothetical protein